MVNKSSWGYVPGIDGLRAIAVILVIVFHAGFTWYPNGYIGVDVFFVLSGFLVTNVLLFEYSQHKRIDIKNFFSRRIKRLLPPAFFTIVVTTIVFWATSSPILVYDYIRNAQAAVLYHANYFQIWESNDYFGGDLTESPFLHFWSLSIEEQFYFVFPFLLIGLLTIQKHSNKIPALILGVLTLLSLVWQITEPNEIEKYYSTLLRAYQLLAGVTLAYLMDSTIQSKKNPVIGWLSLTGLVALGFNLGFSTSFSGIIATFLAVALLYNFSFPGFLKNPITVFIGKMSYGMYLWHWPIIILLKQQTVESSYILFLVGTAGSLILAFISYNIVEKPFRTKRIDPKPVIYAGALVTFSLAIVFSSSLQVLLEDEWNVATFATFSETACELDIQDCLTVDNNSNNSAIIIGDSHSTMLMNTFEDWVNTNDHNLYSYSLGSCPWIRDISGTSQTPRGELCGLAQTSYRPNLIKEVDPDVLFLFSRSYDTRATYPTVYDENGKEKTLTEEETFNIYYESITDTVRFFRTLTDAKIVVIESIPIAPLDMMTQPVCLSLGRSDCSYELNEPSSLSIERSLSEIDGVSVVSIADIMCSENICEPIVDNQIVMRDASHFRKDFAELISPTMIERYNTAIFQSN